MYAVNRNQQCVIGNVYMNSCRVHMYILTRTTQYAKIRNFFFINRIYKSFILSSMAEVYGLFKKLKEFHS